VAEVDATMIYFLFSTEESNNNKGLQ